MTSSTKELLAIHQHWKELLGQEPITPCPTVGQLVEALIQSGQKLDRKHYESVWDCQVSQFRLEEPPVYIPEIVSGNGVEFVVAFTAVPPIKTSQV